MDSCVQEKLNSGILYLYSAFSKWDFYNYLDSFFAEIFQHVSFSVLVPADRPDAFFLDFSTKAVVEGFQRPLISAPELLDTLNARGDSCTLPVEQTTICVASLELPVAAVKVLPSAETAPSIIVFHEVLNIVLDDLVDLEEYVFDHVMAAFRLVREREILKERLDQRGARLEAVRQFGDLLGQLDLETLLSHLMAICTRLTGAQVGSVTLQGGVADDVEWGLPLSVLQELKEKGEGSIASKVVETREAVLVPSYSENPDMEPLEFFRIESFLCVPLASKERVLGTVNLVNADVSRGGQFGEKDKLAVSTLCSLAATAIENAILHRDLLAKRQIEANLQIAQSIQRGMFPVKALDIPGYEMSWMSRSCDETGGDYFDFVKLGEDRIGFTIGDVSGHGMGAALLMATGRATLRALISVNTDLQDVVERLNDILGQDMDLDKFMTLYLGLLDLRDNTMAYVNAGHDQPLFFTPATDEILDLDSTGTPLGMFEGCPYDLGQPLVFAPGDTLLLSTDGIWEARNDRRELYGKSRLKEILRKNVGLGLDDLVALVVADVERHLGNLSPQDDLTLAIIRRTS